MKLLVMSDNHGNISNMKHIIKKENYDVAIHCGDFEISDSKINQMFDYVVIGNNDFGSSIQSDLMIEIEGLKILITHGHRYPLIKGISSDMVENKYGKNLDLVLFGHIHLPSNKIVGKTTYLNPGSIDYPRYGSKKSYLIIEIKNKIIKNIQHKTI